MHDVTFNPLSDSFARDPYASYARLRALDTPYYYADIDTWMLSRAKDVETVILDKTMLRNRDHLLSPAERAAEQRTKNWHDMPYHQRFVQSNLLESEGDTHHRLRKLVFSDFTSTMINRQRDTIQAFVDHLLDDLSDRESFDFIEDFAAHIPGHIIGRLIGVPDADCPLLRIWSEEVVRFFDIGRDDADKQRAETATKAFYDYLLILMAKRRKTPQDDLLTRMISYHNTGAISEDELIATLMLILMAGHGSTIDVLGSGMHALLRFPDQHQKLRDHSDLINLAVQEMFRFESPLPYFHRFSTQDCTIGGQRFPAGTRFGILYSAANRDPARFETPDAFDVARNPNRHLAFGGGAHFCLGNHLARLDMDVIFTTLNAKYSKITLIDEPIYKRSLSVRGPKALHIAVMPA